MKRFLYWLGAALTLLLGVGVSTASADETISSEVVETTAPSTTTVAPILVTPLAPTSTGGYCGQINKTVTPTATEGVIWTPEGTTSLGTGSSVTYEATPSEGYAFPEDAQTSFLVTNEFNGQCNPILKLQVTPSCTSPSFAALADQGPLAADVLFYDAAGALLDTDLLPLPQSTWNTWVEYDGTIPEGSKFVLINNTDWTDGQTPRQSLLPAGDCLVVVTPEPVTFKKAGDHGIYTIPSVEGVEYLVGGEVKSAGEHNYTGTVMVTARAIVGYVLSGKTEWSDTFTLPTTNVPSTSTKAPTSVSSPTTTASSSTSRESSEPLVIDSTVAVVTMTTAAPIDTDVPVVILPPKTTDPVVPPVDSNEPVVVSTGVAIPAQSVAVNATPDGVEAGPELAAVRPGTPSSVGWAVGTIVLLLLGAGFLVQGRRPRSKPAHR